MQGHIKLTDFGLCKIGLNENEQTNSFCGSPEYMAPEIVNRESYSYAVDFYTLGALLYEITSGLPPYYSRNQDEMLIKICNDDLVIPKDLSL